MAKELPADAVAGSPQTVLIGMGGAQCIRVTYTSATLASTIAGTGAGSVQVTFYSENGLHLDASALDRADIIDGAAEDVSDGCTDLT